MMWPQWQRWLGFLVVAGVLVATSFLIFRIFRPKPEERVYTIGYQQHSPIEPGDDADRFGSMSAEVLEEAARRAGIRLRWVYSSESVDEAMRKGIVDLWPTVTHLPERKSFYITSPWMYVDHSLLFTKPPPRTAQLDNRLAFSSIPVNLRIVADSFPHAIRLPTRGQALAVRALCKGEADATLINIRDLTGVLLRRPAECGDAKFWLSPVPGSRTRIGIGSTFAAAAAADALRDQITRIAADGKLSAICHRWSVLSTAEMDSIYELRDARLRSTVLTWSAGGLLLLLLGMMWQVKQVRHSRQAAENSNRAKSEFLANMSHEIRTPLNGVIGIAELLSATHLTQEQRDMTGLIRTSADTLLALVNDLLDFSKIEAGKLAIESEPFDVRETVNSTASLLKPRADAGRLALEVSVDKDVPHLILGDEMRLRQVLLNLLGNAVKFTHTGGIRIEAKQVGDPGEEFAIMFRVIDTGIGIASEVQQRLFTPFTQADAGTTRKYGGTGLGLAISRKLVQHMGGTIGVESKPGQGSTFWFLLPLNRVSELPPDACEPPLDLVPPAGENSHRMARVLIAEDNPINRTVALQAVRRLGYRAETVTNGSEVLTALEHDDYDLILMDCQMPEMDGYQAAAEIRKRYSSGRRVPILAMTANAIEGDHQKCLAAGMDDYLSKPIRIATLASALERWAGGAAHRAIHESAPLSRENA